MPPKAPKLLEDIRDACAYILSVTADQSLESFRSNRMLFQAVERNFEIVGEAIGRLARVDPKAAEKLGEFAQIISFRNMLIHGYDQIDQEVVWDVIRTDAPLLLSRVEQCLKEFGPA